MTTEAANPAPAAETAAPAATEAAQATEPAPYFHGQALEEALASLGQEPETTEPAAEGETETPAEEKPAEEKPAEEKKPEPAATKGKPELRAELFTEAALATPEGIKSARENLLEVRGRVHEQFLTMRKVSDKLEARQGKFNKELGEYKEQRRQDSIFLDAVRNDLKGLFYGTAEQAVAALGRLRGKDPVAALEELNINIAKNGKQPAIPPEVQAQLDEQRAEIANLRASQQQREIEARNREIIAGIETHRRTIGTMISDATTFPHVARIAKNDPQRVVDHVVALIEERNSSPSGERIDFRTAISQIEAQLDEHFAQMSAPATGKPAPNPNAETGTPQTNLERTAPRSPGKTVNPSLAAQTVARPRTLTPEESRAQLANDPVFWDRLGLPL